MKFILIGNYPSDKQESMARYANSLKDGLSDAGISSEIWYPSVFFSKMSKSTISGIGKWLGYIDKWILFPLILKARLTFNRKYSIENVYFHICDHSNSPYLPYLPKKRSGITCHDVLAIRGALGYHDAYCPASSAGKILQKWILSNLRKAERLASVSKFTLNQLYELCPEKIHDTAKSWVVINNFFNANFWPMKEEELRKKLSSVGISLNTEYIFHIGSALPRKNRKMLVELLKGINDKWKGIACFAGEKIDEDLAKLIEDKNLKERIICIEKPDHETLVALYSGCFAFIFPSYSEGFGWPLIEAQACGAPVLASNIDPLQEVSEGSALHADPEDGQDFTNKFQRLLDKSERESLILKGFENRKRFERSHLIQEFIKLYKS